MSSYTGVAARALRMVSGKGASVSFVSLETTYDEARDDSPTITSTVYGSAVRVKGDPRQYAALKLVDQEAATFVFTPSTAGELPALGSRVTWGASDYTVRAVNPVDPAGTGAVMARVVVQGGGRSHGPTEPVADEASMVVASETDVTEAA